MYSKRSLQAKLQIKHFKVHFSILGVIAMFASALLGVSFASSANASNSISSDPRAKPGHPSEVTGLHAIRIDNKLQLITLGWNLNKKIEGVDKYAIYTAAFVEPPLNRALKIVSGNSVTLRVDLNDPIFWVIGHNKFGWGVNDTSAPDPGQNLGKFDPNYLYQTYGGTYLQLHYLDVYCLHVERRNTVAERTFQAVCKNEFVN